MKVRSWKTCVEVEASLKGKRKNIQENKRRGGGTTFLADKVCFRKEPKNFYAFINLWIWNKNEEFGEVDDDEATEQGFYLHWILKFYLNVCVYVCFEECGERDLCFSCF